MGVLGSLSLPVPDTAQARETAPAQPLPSAETVLARYQGFLGGQAALARVTSRITRSRRTEWSATPSDDGLVRFSKTPGLSIMRHEALDGSFVRYMNGCDAEGGWVGYPGPQDDGAPKPGRAPSDGVCRQEQYYYGYLPLDRAKLEQEVQRFEVRASLRIVPADPGRMAGLAGGRGKDLVPPGVRDVYLVLAVPPQGGDGFVWLYFDRETGALLRRADAGHGAAPAPPGENPRYTDFLQYRDVGDGTRVPFQFVTTAPLSEVRAVETEITDNQPLADDVFRRPKDVRRADKGF